MSKRLLASSTVFLTSLLISVSSFSALAAPQVFHNGAIHLFDSKDTVAEWIAIENGKVTASGIGKSHPAGEGVSLVDLGGKTIIPGLTDSHAHLASLGENLSQLDLRGTKSPEEAAAWVKTFAASQKDPGSPIIGNNWDQSTWPGQKFPNRTLLDAVSSTRPIILYRVDGHAAWVNTVALKKSGIWKNKKNPKGGKIIRAAGLPTGILIDTAMKKLGDLTEPPSVGQLEESIRLAVREAVRHGIVSVHDAGAGPRELQAIRNLLETKKVAFRFYEMVSASDPAELKAALEKGIEVAAYDDQLTVRTVKLFQDGAMGSRGAAFHQAYHDDPGNVGLLRMEGPALVKQFTAIDAKGFQIAVHAIGSRANETVIDALEKVMGEKIGVKRPRLEHAQVLTERDVRRIGKLGIIPSMQPVHCTSDMKWVVARIGESRARFAYAWKSLLEAKAQLAFGSDAPVEDINPWHGLFAATTRQDASFQPAKGFFPEQKLSRKEAFRAFTLGGAYSAFEETTAGSLEVGKRADFVILNVDPFGVTPAELRGIQVEATFISGKTVFARDAEAPGA